LVLSSSIAPFLQPVNIMVEYFGQYDCYEIAVKSEA
jgi:hypothetical protein